MLIFVFTFTFYFLCALIPAVCFDFGIYAPGCIRSSRFSMFGFVVFYISLQGVIGNRSLLFSPCQTWARTAMREQCKEFKSLLTYSRRLVQ